MPRQAAIRVEGASRLRRDLKAAGREVTDLKDTHQRVAEIVRDAAQVPVLTGRLRQSLKPKGTVASAIVRSTVRVPYGNPIHWGWAKRGIRPNPFLYDAMDKRRGDIEDAYLQGVTKALNKIKGTTTR
jgi:hypothetical protein